MTSEVSKLERDIVSDDTQDLLPYSNATPLADILPGHSEIQQSLLAFEQDELQWKNSPQSDSCSPTKV